MKRTFKATKGEYTEKGRIFTKIYPTELDARVERIRLRRRGIEPTLAPHVINFT